MMGRLLIVGAVMGAMGCSWPHDVERPLEPTPDCGDGYLTSDEECDDGNQVQEACEYGDTTCTVCGSECTEVVGITSYCGDGREDSENEGCDDGNESDNDGCVSGCTAAVCGDGFNRQDLSSGEPGYEECDDGNTVQEVCAYGELSCTVCNSECLNAPGATSYCGDQLTDSDNGEACDDGNQVVESCAYGELDCTVCGQNCQDVSGTEQFCGDGTVQAEYEGCDDGNTISEACVDNPNQPCQVCGETCAWEAGNYCGNGVVDDNNSEECDDGNQVVESCDYGDEGCTVCGANCLLVAGIAEVCGDGVIQGVAGEECDDGNAVTEACLGDVDSCTVCGAHCTWVQGAFCGDGDVTVDIGEECDDANNIVEECEYGEGACQVCDACTLVDSPARACGDGTVDVGFETCDDSNTETEFCGNFTGPCQVCGETCTLVSGEFCGDGLVRDGVEDCDDGNNGDDGNGCTGLCVNNSVCGNGTLEDLFEVCDDGYTDSCGTCNDTCTGSGEGYGEGTEHTCSDGEVCPEYEVCDDGNMSNLDGCLNSCEQASCGDAYLREGLSLGDGGYEECDDGDTLDGGNGCTAACLRNDVCGNGVTEGLFEVCDDGFADSCGECNEDCSGAGVEAICGDGVVCAISEQCDDGNNITEVCEYGVRSGCFTCDSDCQMGNGLYDYCGDGIVNAGYEECDDGLANSYWCADGQSSCTICTPACEIQGVGGGGGGGGSSCDGDDQVTYYLDSDFDGYGDVASPLDCSFEPYGYATNSDDCDDTNGYINPGKSEVCNGIDDNCNSVADEGVMGLGEACPAASCYAVFADHLPSGTQNTWLERSGEDPRVVECDYGVVGAGWSFARTLTISNDTADDWSTVSVSASLDTASLATAGKLRSKGQDLRVFTEDDGLLDYWYGGPVGTDATPVWIEVPFLAAGQSMELILTYGNAAADARSQSLFYDGFEADTRALYSLETTHLWDPGADFEWVADQGRYEATGFNDYFWMVGAEVLESTASVYIETRGYWFDDDDGLGVVLSTPGGDFYVAEVSNDYDGVAFSTSYDGIVRYGGVPSDHLQGEYTLALGDVIDAAYGMRVGLWAHNGYLELIVNGESLGATPWPDSGVQGVGLGSLANQTSQFGYLWVSSERPAADFEPDQVTSPATSAPILGAEQGI